MDQTTTRKPEQIIRELLQAIGEDPDREGLKDTPKRVVKSWGEIFGGYNADIPKILEVSFGTEYSGMVLADTIKFHSTCEHHMLPFFGVAHVAYVPKDNRVIGYSKFGRLVKAYAQRLQIQERLTTQVAEAIMEHAKPHGSAVVMEAAHLCSRCRGLNSPDSVMQTTALRGCFETDSNTRAEFFNRIPRRKQADI